MSELLTIDLVRPDENALDRAANAIKAGKLVVYPTETIYGLGTDAMNRVAVYELGQVKQRREDKPISVIVGSIDALDELTTEVPDVARRLIDRFWPGPLTIVFRARPELPQPLTKGSGTIGIRIPSSNLCLALVKKCGRPVTATSANVSGEPVFPTASEIRGALGEGVDIYLEAGILPVSEPSTVVDVSGGDVRMLRSGAIPREVIEKISPITTH